MNKRFFIISGLILVAALSRMIPHPYNFAPIGAMSIFGAAYFANKKIAFILPILALFVSDLLVNNILYSDYYSGFVLISPGFMWVYGAVVLIVLAGLFLVKKVSLFRVISGSLAASIIFFVVTNFGVWFSTATYPYTFTGLMACYTAAIPFFHNTILGDLVYSGVLFGAFEFAKQRFPVLQEVS